MSLTRTGRAVAWADFHSSNPWTPSEAVKNTLPPTTVNSRGLLAGVCGLPHPAAAGPSATEPVRAVTPLPATTVLLFIAPAVPAAAGKLPPANVRAAAVAATTVGLATD